MIKITLIVTISLVGTASTLLSSKDWSPRVVPVRFMPPKELKTTNPIFISFYVYVMSILTYSLYRRYVWPTRRGY